MKMQYAVTESLKSMLEKTSIDECLEIFRGLDFLIERFSYYQEAYGKAETIMFVRELLEKAIAEADFKNVSCKAGCSFCCRINVDTTETEAAVVVAYAKEHGIEIDIAALKEQATAHNDDRPFLKHAKCVFLGEDNLCKVYEVRPNACRKYFVITEPYLCEATKENLRSKDVGVSVSWRIEIIASALINIEESGNFSQLLLNEIL